MPHLVTAYPDDLRQNQADRRNPPIRQAQAMKTIRDHARQHQGGGVTGEVGGDRPAEARTSALAPIDGRDDLPGEDASARGEAHWHAPLPVRLLLSGPAPRELRTLADAGAFLSGRYGTLEHSAALQRVAIAVIAAARTGSPDDVAYAAERLRDYIDALRLG